MFKEKSTEKLIEFIQTLPIEERKFIAKHILDPKKETTKNKVLKDIKHGLLEIKEAKRAGKKLKTLSAFLNEL